MGETAENLVDNMKLQEENKWSCSRSHYDCTKQSVWYFDIQISSYTMKKRRKEVYISKINPLQNTAEKISWLKPAIPVKRSDCGMHLALMTECI